MSNEVRDGGVGYEKAYRFAIRVVNAYKHLLKEHQEYVLSKQMLRAGTAIGANLAEANAAISEVDLSAKVSIAYKEVQECKYWLNLLNDTGYLTDKAHFSLYTDADEIAAILFTTLKTTRINRKKSPPQNP